MWIGAPNVGIGGGVGFQDAGIAVFEVRMAGSRAPNVGIGASNVRIGFLNVGIGGPNVRIGAPNVGIGAPNVGIQDAGIAVFEVRMWLSGAPSAGIGGSECGDRVFTSVLPRMIYD